MIDKNPPQGPAVVDRDHDGRQGGAGVGCQGRVSHQERARQQRVLLVERVVGRVYEGPEIDPRTVRVVEGDGDRTREPIEDHVGDPWTVGGHAGRHGDG